MTLPVQITVDQRALVAELAGYGLTLSQIASALKLYVRTLQRHCQEDYDNGKNIAIERLLAVISGHQARGHPS